MTMRSDPRRLENTPRRLEGEEMNRSRGLLTPAVAALIMSLVAISPLAGAQSHGLAVKPLLRTTVSGDATKEAVVATAEFAPGGTTGRHFHPGDEYATVLEGALELRVDGRAPRRVRAGEAYHNPRGVIHETRNVGNGRARVASTFIIEKGKPLLEPVK
jgi:quercetin dioxygenase-like cupin family protein